MTIDVPKDLLTMLASDQTVHVIRQGNLRRFTIAVDSKMRPGMFSSERAAIAGFGFTDVELETLCRVKARTGGAIGLADLAGLREDRA